jgi:hypothetical protein
LLILKDEADAWLPVAVIEKEPSAGRVVSASDALNVAKPGFTLSPSTFLRQARGRHIDMRPNWKEQPTGPSLTGKVFR